MFRFGGAAGPRRTGLQSRNEVVIEIANREICHHTPREILAHTMTFNRAGRNPCDRISSPGGAPPALQAASTGAGSAWQSPLKADIVSCMQ